MVKRGYCIAVLLLALSFCMFGCSNGGRAGDTDNEDSQETSEMPSSADSSETSETAWGTEGDIVPLTADDIDGIWVDESGFVCEFDMERGIFTDLYGDSFDIIGINESGVEVRYTGDSEPYMSDQTITMPVPVGVSFTVPAVMRGGYMYVLDSCAEALDSDAGSEISEDLSSVLGGCSLSCMGGMAEMNISEDLSSVTLVNLMTTETQPLECDFDGATLTVANETVNGVEYVRMIPRVYSNGDIRINYSGSTYMMSGTGAVYGRWIRWNRSTENFEIIDLTDPERITSYDPLTDETSVLDIEAPEMSLGSFMGNFQIELDGKDYVPDTWGSTLGVYRTLFAADDDLDYDDLEMIYLISMNSPLAQEMIRRYITINSPAGELSEAVYDLGDGSIIYERYENQWDADIIEVYPCNMDADDFDYASLEIHSGSYAVHFSDPSLYETAVIRFPYEGTPSEITSIYLVDSYSGGDAFERIDTDFTGGYACAPLSREGIYVLADVVLNETVDRSNFFDVDPTATSWGNSSGVGDVPSLVDLDYLRQCHANGDYFPISNASELASFTYFVNTYPRTYEDYMVIWAELTEDIDLSQYEWTPAGLTSPDRSFSGIFNGMGHTISGLHIDGGGYNNAFFGEAYASTIIGLRLEGVCIGGSNAVGLCSRLSTTDVIDCRVTGELPDSDATGSDVFPEETDFGNNHYYDCTFSISDAAGLQEGRISGDRSQLSNWVASQYDPEGDGTYDYSSGSFLN